MGSVFQTFNPSNTTQQQSLLPDHAYQPLRVIRFKEADLTAANDRQLAGRMVISGRMSDVCDALERMAA